MKQLREEPCLLVWTLEGTQCQPTWVWFLGFSSTPISRSLCLVLILSQPTQRPTLPDCGSTLLHTWLSLYLGARLDCTGTQSLPAALQPGAPRQPGCGLEGGLSAVSRCGKGEVKVA